MNGPAFQTVVKHVEKEQLNLGKQSLTKNPRLVKFQRYESTVKKLKILWQTICDKHLHFVTNIKI